MTGAVLALGEALRAGRDLLLPRVCAVCHEAIPDDVGGRVCALCLGAFEDLSWEAARACAACGTNLTTEGCRACRARKGHRPRVRTFGAFEGRLREAVHALKFGRDPSVGLVLGRLAARAADDAMRRVHLVVPVPLHGSRLLERGFNQSAVIAREVARRLGLRLEPCALARTRATAEQSGAGRRERHENVAGAFVADPALVGGRRVLLVDDVLTTGATVGACERALRQARAAAVHVLAVARAQGPS